MLVSNGVQTASCTVNVTNFGATTVQYPSTTSASPLSLVSNYIPALLPNTGFEPLSSAALAFAVVLLLGAGIFVYPYVKKAIVVAAH